VGKKRSHAADEPPRHVPEVASLGRIIPQDGDRRGRGRTIEETG
jgi:hypothetical protein